jgi:hypothetical protein
MLQCNTTKAKQIYPDEIVLSMNISLSFNLGKIRKIFTEMKKLVNSRSFNGLCIATFFALNTPFEAKTVRKSIH